MEGPLGILCVLARFVGSLVFTEPRVQRGFSVKFLSWKFWNTTQDLGSWSAQAFLSQHSWLGMILILPLGIWVQVHRNATSSIGPPPKPPILGDSGLGQVGQSLHLALPASKAHPQKAPKAWSEVLEGFSRWNFGASQQVVWTPKKSVQRVCEKNHYKNPCITSAQTSGQRIYAKKNVQNSVQKSMLKIRAKNPCKKTVQKIRAAQKNPCKANPCKWFLIVNLQVEKPNVYNRIWFVLFFCKLVSPIVLPEHPLQLFLSRHLWN